MTAKDEWTERRNTVDTERPEDCRDAYQRDFSRVVHCASFRRLQGKTQVLGLGDSDFYRTRLTHSMEVAQVAGGIATTLKNKYKNTPRIKSNEYGYCLVDASQWLPSTHLISAIGLAHDLGHPPFGHGGEVALNYCMKDYGGFEGNGQTLRILSRLEKYTKDYGINPTRRLLLGILKYPVNYSLCKKLLNIDYNENPHPTLPWLIKNKNYKPPKCYMDSEIDIVDWIFAPFNKYDEQKFRCMGWSRRHFNKDNIHYYHSLDTSILEIADDICYASHDLEDAITLGLVSEDEFLGIMEKNDEGGKVTRETEAALQNESLSTQSSVKLSGLIEDLFSDETCTRKQAFGGLIHLFISHCDLIFLDEFHSPLLALNAVLPAPYCQYLKILQKVFRELVISKPEVQQMEFRGQRIVIELFNIFSTDPRRLLPTTTLKKYDEQDNEYGRKRIICDYISGMTDEYASRVYERLSFPSRGSVFDRR